ncbi:hypothetical protein [Mesorhizobium sp.]|uniref:hypothetical protein n=1 Tax=Mesorhizobium sp. TaxID=1871066 RepID=UPI000FE4AB53|nr:hypothetical protein [Mesorhizobium sp.]RWM29374.1 MAG: hypothetical protein EOR74_06755 [Mesorhizobium sp.]
MLQFLRRGESAAFALLAVLTACSQGDVAAQCKKDGTKSPSEVQACIDDFYSGKNSAKVMEDANK